MTLLRCIFSQLWKIKEPELILVVSLAKRVACPLVAATNGVYLALPGPVDAVLQAYAGDMDDTLPLEPSDQAPASESFSLALPNVEVEIPPTQPDLDQDLQAWIVGRSMTISSYPLSLLIQNGIPCRCMVVALPSM